MIRHSRDSRDSAQAVQDSSAPPSKGLLERLRSADAVVRDAAVCELHEQLTRFVRSRTERPEVVPQSVANSVVFGALAEKSLDDFAHDGNLWSWLLTVARHRLLDRIRRIEWERRRIHGFGVDDEGRIDEPAASADGPGTQLGEIEEMIVAETDEAIFAELALFLHFHEMCLAAPISETQRRFLELWLFEDRSNEEVAALCDTTVATVKTRLASARKSVRRHLVEPLCLQLSDQERQIVEAVCVDRLRSEAAAERIGGIGKSEVRAVVRETLTPWLLQTYGKRGTALFSTHVLGQRHGA